MTAVQPVTASAVRAYLYEVVRERLHLQPLDKADDAHFFGRQWQLDAYQLVYLGHFLEQNYAVRFEPEDYDGPDFFTVNGLSRLVARKTTAERGGPSL